jgi:hypothetical protein
VGRGKPVVSGRLVGGDSRRFSLVACTGAMRLRLPSGPTITTRSAMSPRGVAAASVCAVARWRSRIALCTSSVHAVYNRRGAPAITITVPRRVLSPVTRLRESCCTVLFDVEPYTRLQYDTVLVGSYEYSWGQLWCANPPQIHDCENVDITQSSNARPIYNRHACSHPSLVV